MALTFGEKIDFNKQVLSEQIKELRNLALIKHYVCDDDNYYTCNAHEDSFSGDPTCNCGADDHNNKVDEVYEEIMENFFN